MCERFSFREGRPWRVIACRTQRGRGILNPTEFKADFGLDVDSRIPRYRAGFCLRIAPSGKLHQCLFLLPLCFREVFFCSKLHHFADQAERNGLVERELQSALARVIWSQIFPELLNASGRGIEPDMIFEGCEMN